jgi:hypothetical protein
MPDLPTLSAHDAGLLALAIFVAIAFVGALWIERRHHRRERAEELLVFRARVEVDQAGVLARAERKFWDDLHAGPCRLTERQIERKAKHLAEIRSIVTDSPFGPHAILDAEREILQHVGRAI